MRKILFAGLFVFVLAFAASAQEVSLPREVAEKALKAMELVPELEGKISALEVTVKELERSKQTPCTIAQEKLKLDLTYWLDQFNSAAPDGKKQIAKILKETRKSGRKSVSAQCGWKSENQFIEWLKIAGGLAPLALLF